MIVRCAGAPFCAAAACASLPASLTARRDSSLLLHSAERIVRRKRRVSRGESLQRNIALRYDGRSS